MMFALLVLALTACNDTDTDTGVGDSRQDSPTAQEGYCAVEERVNYPVVLVQEQDGNWRPSLDWYLDSGLVLWVPCDAIVRIGP